MSQNKYIIIVGRTGTGKSTLVNSLLGLNLAKTSNSATSCTAENKYYQIPSNNLRVIDTIGLQDNSNMDYKDEQLIKDAFKLVAEDNGAVIRVILCTNEIIRHDKSLLLILNWLNNIRYDLNNISCFNMHDNDNLLGLYNLSERIEWDANNMWLDKNNVMKLKKDYITNWNIVGKTFTFNYNFCLQCSKNIDLNYMDEICYGHNTKQKHGNLIPWHFGSLVYYHGVCNNNHRGGIKDHGSVFGVGPGERWICCARAKGDSTCSHNTCENCRSLSSQQGCKSKYSCCGKMESCKTKCTTCNNDVITNGCINYCNDCDDISSIKCDKIIKKHYFN